ncbi:MAG: hypothetical protein M3238_02100 [Actinomycetota bacterium]|nr:hypothetical protein [Actinomycetota bacterium]
MRSKLLGGLLAAAMVGGSGLVPAHAQEPAPEVPAVVNIEDPAGDANYLNGQGADDSQGNNVTPADIGSVSDILKVWFTSDATNISAHIQTEAMPPAVTAYFFRVLVDPSVGDPNCLRFQIATSGAGNPGEAFGSLRDLCGDVDETYTEGITVNFAEAADGTGISTVTIPRTTHPAFAEGTVLVAPTAHVRNYFVAVTAPQIDDTQPGTDFTVSSGQKKKKGCAKGSPKAKKKGCKK